MEPFDGYETFTEEEQEILDKFVTNTSGNIFALRNLPEVIKGALFSRYSRSKLGLRSLLLKEFVQGGEAARFTEIAGPGSGSAEQALAISKAQDFYDRILDGYGDDSIGELGGAHLALENISMLAAKEIEDCRIGGSPLEKSTRYIYFDQKHNGEYLYYREPVLMTSAHRKRYLETCDHLFSTYSSLIEPLTKLIRKDFPHEEGVSKIAYNATLRAKVLDCLRGLLPSSALTNMGVFGNGRFFEGALRRLQHHNLGELQETGRRAREELEKVIPSFVRRTDPEHRHYLSHCDFMEAMVGDLQQQAERVEKEPGEEKAHVRLVECSPDAIYRVAEGLLFPHTSASLSQLQKHVRSLSAQELTELLESASRHRENRRHKSPRGLERAECTFDIVADFGCYRDLQRHRMLTQDRQLLTCDYGYYVPKEIVGTEIEKPYREALDRAAQNYYLMAAEFPEEAQYVVPMAYNMRWYFHCNLRALQWMCELRSQPQGHPAYRQIAQQMAKAVCKAVPEFAAFFEFVDFQGDEQGRLDQEKRANEKKQALSMV